MRTLILAAPRRAFTLIELIVVIVIIGVLAAVAAVSYSSFISGTAEQATESGATQIGKVLSVESATEQVDLNTYADTGDYPALVLEDIDTALSEHVSHVTVNPSQASAGQFALAGTASTNLVPVGKFSVCNSDYSYCLYGNLPATPGEQVLFTTTSSSGGTGGGGSTPTGPTATFNAIDAKRAATTYTLGGTFTDQVISEASGPIATVSIAPAVNLAASYDASTPNFLVAANDWRAFTSVPGTTPVWVSGYVSDADLATLKGYYATVNTTTSTFYNPYAYPVKPGALYPTTCSDSIATLNDQLRSPAVESYMLSAPVAEFMFVKVDREVTDQAVQALPSTFCP